MVALESFVLTPAEARAFRGYLAAQGLVAPDATPPVPAFTSRPLTADCNLAAPAFWLEDKRLPKVSRTALRAASVVSLINFLVRSLGEGIRKWSFLAALKKVPSASRQSGQLWASVFAYTALYRSFVHALAFLRLLAIANASSLAPSSIHEECRITIPSSSTSSKNRAHSSLTYRARIFAHCLRFLRSNSTPAFFAALLACPALFLLLPATTIPTVTIGLWLISNVSSAAYNQAKENGSRLVGWIPDWCNSSLLYALGNGQLLWSFLFESHAFPASYGRVILARSSTYIAPRPHRLPAHVKWPSRQTITDHIAVLATPTPTSKPFPSFTSPLLSALTPSHPPNPFTAINPVLDYSPAHPAHSRLMCAMLHPTEPSCKQTFINHFKNEWLASARFAGAFALVSSLVFRRKSWIRDPETQIFKVAAATVQGASIISGSIGTSWALICFFQKFLPPSVFPRSRFFLNGFVSSYIWIHVVPPGRRRELALYTARSSLQSSWKILEKKGKVKALPKGDVAILALGLALLAAVYESGGNKSKGGRAAGTADSVQSRNNAEEETLRPRLEGATDTVAKWLFGDRIVATA